MFAGPWLLRRFFGCCVDLGLVIIVVLGLVISVVHQIIKSRFLHC